MDVATNFVRNREKIREYDNARTKNTARKQKQAGYALTSRANNPEKYRARTAVNNAVRDGRLVREPCKVCGTTERVQGHHSDYHRPLDVEWLCFYCHRTYAHGQRFVDAGSF